jgi:hypothetical protein
MKTDRYISPAIKVHASSYKLLQIGVASGYNGGDIESKGNNAFEDDEQNNAWGRVWER